VAADAALAQDTFLRRVLHSTNFLEWHDDFNRWVPTLAGVRFDPDGMSAFVSRLLGERGHGPADVSTLGGTSDKRAVVYEFDQAAVSEAGFTVSLSPNDDTPIGYAHASIEKPTMTREAEREARTKLAARMSLVFGKIELSRPDGA
jgi:hypothetical protein